MTTEPDTHALYNVPESFYHERSTKEPSYQRDTSAKRLITTTTTTTGLARLKYRGGGIILAQVCEPVLFLNLPFFYHWHDRMRSLRQGVRIWNFEEKTKQTKKKQEKSFGCVLTKYSNHILGLRKK